MRSKLVLLLILSAPVLFLSCKKHAALPGPPDDGHETNAYKLTAFHENIGSNSGGYYEALPPSYDTSTEKFPVLMFIHGGGELGDGSAAELDKVLVHSVSKRIAEKTLPVKFTSNGKDFSFVIVMPQFKDKPTAKDVKDVFHYVLNKYRVDSSRIYLSGLSLGGGATWEYAGSEEGKILAAIVPICGASWADSTVAKRIAKNAVPAWAFHNDDDPVVTVNSTWRYARIINAEDPPVPVRVTIWPTGGHDAWTQASSPDYKEEGKNMYEWMLQYTRE